VSTTSIFIALGVWLAWTLFIIFFGRWLSKKRGWFYAGVLALIGAVIGVLAIHMIFGVALQCQAAYCWADKARADTLLQFVLITWGAMGGAILARAVDEK